MLLFDGMVLENTHTDNCIENLYTLIPRTLSMPFLSHETVIKAAQSLLQDYHEGNLKQELQLFIDESDFNLVDIETVIQKFNKEALYNRINQELGQLYHDNDILIAPKGVLLHIAAGNLDILPAYSVLEGLLTGNINLLKLPSADNGLSVFLLKKLISFEPILKNYIYVFDTHSSDLLTIQKLMKLSNAIVIWGSDEAVSSVRKNAPINTEIIEWGHKLSFCYLHDIHVSDESLRSLARHIFTTNQLLCNSCQGIYVNTDQPEDIQLLASRFALILNDLEQDYPLADYLQGKITVSLLTKKLESMDDAQKIFINQRSSVTCKDDSILELSELYGNLWIKPLLISEIHEKLFSMRSHLQTVILSSMDKKLIQAFASVGCTQINHIDKLSYTVFNKTHDGKQALQHYVRLVEIV